MCHLVFLRFASDQWPLSADETFLWSLAVPGGQCVPFEVLGPASWLSAVSAPSATEAASGVDTSLFHLAACSAGLPHVGVGHCIAFGPGFSNGGGEEPLLPPYKFLSGSCLK